MKSPRKKIRVLVTGGPTRAYLNRVRFLTNVSSGALAYELCRTLQAAGIEVALVAGPTSQPFAKLKLAELVEVETHLEMHAEVMRLCREFRPDAAVFTAAVLDFAPVKVQSGKMSSKTKSWTIRLKPTRKIIDDVGRRHPKVRRIGFKLEWARSKAREGYAAAFEALEKKQLDAVCLNFLSEIKDGKHPAVFVTSGGTMELVESKPEIARVITENILAP